ncbi:MULTISPECIES: cytochrome P450 [Gordonia]|uniref:cytochrome P450 n=1 Tax=Gordonia TaxID=2053 RepID=UPI00257AD358|nr:MULTISPECIES: cytochrome P450 [Gordonia]
METIVSQRGAPAFELRSDDSWRNPFEMYARLRRLSPVHHVAAQDYWVLTRHADVFAAASDPLTFSSAAGLTMVYDELEAIGLADNPPLVMQDPPQHTAFRSLVARGFTPRQVTSIEPRVREFVVERLERLDGDGPTDIVGELFKPLPSMVVAHYLGVPDEDWTRFDDWTAAIVGALAGSEPAASNGSRAAASNGSLAAASNGSRAAAATSELLTYFGELVEHRRAHPGDDTVSALVDAGVADDPAGLVSILAFVFTMITGGNDTTTGLLGGSVDLLSAYPEQRRRLVDDPTLIPDAVGELLRLTSPVQGLARTTTRAVAYTDTPDGPVTVPQGRKVLLCYAAANRDESVFGPDAEHLDVERRPRRILSFSHGHHHCLGAAAARMQARVALTELLARHPDFDVDPDGITYAPGNYVRRPTYVPFYADGSR